VKRHAPATERNREPILAVLREVLPERGMVLEVASGTGEHAVHFARAFPRLLFQPTDPDPEAVASIEAWRREARLDNVMPAAQLDARVRPWPAWHPHAILCINMIHIAPWTATEGLMRGAGQLLEPGAPLLLYGPYRRGGVATASSNEAFDASLKARNPEWGLRTLEDVTAEAEKNGLTLERIAEMPANNLTVVFRKG